MPCRYVPADLSKIRALPFVAWVNVYLHVFKISPRLRPAAAANALTLAPVPASISKDRVTVEIVLHKDSMTDAVRNQIAAAAGVDPTQLQAGRDKIRLTVERGGWTRSPGSTRCTTSRSIIRRALPITSPAAS
jgi:hypothetical protein